MSDIKICIDCKERPVHIYKRSLCQRCYQKLRHKQGPFIKSDHKYCERLRESKENSREIMFIQNYFTHSDWIYQPALFRMNGISYSPDFYDCQKNVWIEVAGSRQAYHQNKLKYNKFVKCFPKLNFEVRTPDGKLLNDKTHGEMWSFQKQAS